MLVASKSQELITRQDHRLNSWWFCFRITSMATLIQPSFYLLSCSFGRCSHTDSSCNKIAILRLFSSIILVSLDDFSGYLVHHGWNDQNDEYFCENTRFGHFWFISCMFLWNQRNFIKNRAVFIKSLCRAFRKLRMEQGQWLSVPRRPPRVADESCRSTTVLHHLTTNNSNSFGPTGRS